MVDSTAWNKNNIGKLEWWHDEDHVDLLMEALGAYFEYYSDNDDVEYPEEKIREHRIMASGHFHIDDI
jgi:hypothetical protein